MWRKAALVVLWVAGMALIALRFGDRYEERSVETARLRVVVLPAVAGEELPGPLQVEVDAEIAAGGDRVRLVVEAGDVPKANPNGPEMEVVMDAGDEVYLRVFEGGRKAPVGGAWVRMDLHEAERVIPGFGAVANIGDAGMLTASRPPEDLEPAGRETIDGVETTRYEATLESLDESVAELGAPFANIREALGEDAELTFWEDDDGFTRRFAFTTTASYLAPRKGGDQRVVLQYDILDLGEEITVELPDPDDTISV